MTAATGKPRGRPRGIPKSGGRIAGKSLDKQARQLVSAELAGSILETFQRLGGVDDMLKWAAANRSTFYTAVLARLYPAAARDDEPASGNTYNQINVGNTSDREAALRIAFVLNAAMHADPGRVVEHSPVAERVPPVTPHQDAYHAPPAERAPVFQPEPVDDPERERWASELPLSAAERADQALIRETKEVTIESYRGSNAEQFGSGMAQRSNGKPSAGELCRRLSRRGRDLL